MEKITYEKNDEPIVLSKHTMDIFLKDENPIEVIGLYCLYYYTAKWQSNNTVYATTGYCAKALSRSEQKIRQIKSRLIKLGLIENVIRRDDKQVIIGHYIRVKFIFSNNNDKIHPNVFPDCGLSHTVDNHKTNTKDTNIEIPYTNNKIQNISLFSNIESNQYSNEEIVDKWNTLANDNEALAKACKINNARKKKLSLRCAEFPTKEMWDKIFDNIRNSDFLKGVNDRKWVITFDWLISSEKNITKVYEGNYNPKITPTKITPSADELMKRDFNYIPPQA